jgi:2-polyprenyl-3-methyl-5-hydroxy-6-metoxy-1,4-benzoquinol methylase
VEYTCQICKSTSYERINTYKYYWYSCNDCGNAFSRQKDRYLLSSPIFSIAIKLINKLAFNKLRFLEKDYLRSNKVRQDNSTFYSSYADLLEKNDPGLKSWLGQFKLIQERFAASDISFHNKKVLVLSGGPGICAKEISKLASKVVVTEYSIATVLAMKKYLNLEAVKFDLNSDRLDELFQEDKFDIIIAESLVGFCLDLEKFVQSLRNILKVNGIVYINHGSPTLAQMLFYQFDEYTPLVMQQRESF